MRVTHPCAVALSWRLQDSLGQVLDTQSEPIEFVVGAHELLPIMEQALEGKQEGDELDLHVEPQQAFGHYDERLVFLIEREHLPPNAHEGMLIEASDTPAALEAGADPGMLLAITEIYPQHAVIDGNHPLAGISLRMHLKVARVRQANQEELSRINEPVGRRSGVGFFRMNS